MARLSASNPVFRPVCAGH